MKCPFCGHENIEGNDTCAKCNVDLTHLDEPVAQSDMERLIMRKPVSGIKQPSPCSVTGNTSVREVVDVLSSNNIGAVLICEDGEIEGIFSERDLLLKIGVDYPHQRETPIREFMTTKPVTIEGGDTIAVALNRMDVGDYRHLPITEEAGGDNVKGIISVRDILKYIVDNAN